MGSLIYLQKLCKMKILILSCFISVAFGQLVTHWNGAVTPVDHANFAATAAHLAIKGHPYVYYGKREAEAEAEADPQYLTYGHHLGHGHLGYAGYGGYPYTTYYGKREAEADPQYLTYGHHLGYSHLGYAGYPYTTYYGKRDADSQYLGYGYGHHLGYSHLGYAGYAGYPYTYYGKRDAEAEPQVLTYGVPAVHHYVPAVHHLSYAAVVVPGLVAHPNGAIVPVEPHEVVKARAEHLAAKASA